MASDDGRLDSYSNSGYDVRSIDEMMTYRRSENSLRAHKTCSK